MMIHSSNTILSRRRLLRILGASPIVAIVSGAFATKTAASTPDVPRMKKSAGSLAEGDKNSYKRNGPRFI